MFAALLLAAACNPNDFDHLIGPADDGGGVRTSDGSSASEPQLSWPDAASDAAASDAASDIDARGPFDAQGPGSDAAADVDAARFVDGSATDSAANDGAPPAHDATISVDAAASCFSAATSLISYLRLDGVPTDALSPERGGASVVAVGAEFGDGRVGSALHGGELALTQSRLDAPSALTISAWVKLDNVPAHLNAAWLWKGDDSGEDFTAGYYLVFAGLSFRAENARYLTGSAALGHLGLGLTNGLEEQFLLTDQPFPLQRYVHVVATFDGTRARLYLDGEVERDDVQQVVVRPTSVPVRLASPVGGALAPLAGELDEVAFFDRALSPSEVSELYTRSGLVCTD